jgi:hypothetical protein
LSLDTAQGVFSRSDSFSCLHAEIRVQGVAIVALDGSGHKVWPASRPKLANCTLPSFPHQHFEFHHQFSNSTSFCHVQVITAEKKGWFYHRALLFDVNADGKSPFSNCVFL